MEIISFFADKSHVRTSGRTYFKDNILYLGYTASYVEFEFTGTHASAEIWSDLTPPEEIFRAYACVFINGSDVPEKRLKIDSEKAEYELFSSDTPQKVTIRLMKMSEAAFAKFGITKLTVTGENVYPTVSDKTRRIEFVGDSITCGYGIDGIWNKDTFSTETENPLKGFALNTAHLCNADYQFVSWSGIGLISAYVDENAEKPLDDWTMPMIYPYTDRGLENILGITEHELWDFSRFVPQIVVFNLGTNDQSYTKDIKERRETFEGMYFDFLKVLRKNNPNAHIVCTYGVMGQNILAEEMRQAERFKSEVDNRITYVPLDVQLESDGIGADWHPSEVTHAKVAKVLSAKLNEIFESMGL